MKFLILIVLMASWGMGIGQSDAQVIVPFGSRETKITGAIPYSVIGQYTVHFSAFKGRITLDRNSERIQSVYLEIDANSIRSNCPWCDKLARSRKLLNTARYPKIIFKSDKILQDENGFQVKGFLEMHGVKRRMTFPFKMGVITDPRTKRKGFDLQGIWSINRKDFNIIWDKYLDRGGVLVGDHFTVDWAIKVAISSS